MRLHPVVSSNITRIGYSRATETLVIEFHGGRAYTYQNVPFPVCGALFRSSSKGKAFHRLVRDRFEYERVS